MSISTNLETQHHIPEDLWKPQIKNPMLFMIHVVMLLVAPSYCVYLLRE